MTKESTVYKMGRRVFALYPQDMNKLIQLQADRINELEKELEDVKRERNGSHKK